MRARSSKSNEGVPCLTPKRLKADSGIDTMYPYYAGFSSRFASSMLRDLQLPSDALVLDPWNGSGTTTTAASVLGLSAVGVDLNPFACAIAAAKLVPRCHEERLSRLAREGSEEAARRTGWASAESDPLGDWLPPLAASYARALVSAIRRKLRHSAPQRALLLVALARALRPHAITRTKNPTWPVPSQSTVDPHAIAAQFAEQTEAVLALLQQAATIDTRITVGDARALPVRPGTVNALLTSPPYFTRIDYAAKTRFELALFGHRPQNALRQRLMGTTALRSPKPTETPADWPPAIRTLVNRIRRHPSHRSTGYYYPNAIQYFGDAIKSVSEIRRVLVPGGHALLVLQDSFYKELHVDLPALFMAIARSFGLGASVVHTESVGVVMTNINTASRKYLPTRAYTESVIRIRNGA